MQQAWRQAGHSIADKLFQYRFVQQFAALFYKNGEWWGLLGAAAAGVGHRASQCAAAGSLQLSSLAASHWYVLLSSCWRSALLFAKPYNASLAPTHAWQPRG